MLCCVYKNVSNIEVCDFNPAPLRTLSIKHIIVVLYLNLVLPQCNFSANFCIRFGLVRFRFLNKNFIFRGIDSVAVKFRFGRSLI